MILKFLKPDSGYVKFLNHNLNASYPYDAFFLWCICIYIKNYK